MVIVVGKWGAGRSRCMTNFSSHTTTLMRGLVLTDHHDGAWIFCVTVPLISVHQRHAWPAC